MKTSTHISVCALALLCFFPSTGIAQEQMPRLSNRSSSLPDAPVPNPDGSMQGNVTGDAQGTASISGRLLDSTGGAIPGAQVNLPSLTVRFTCAPGIAPPVESSSLPEMLAVPWASPVTLPCIEPSGLGTRASGTELPPCQRH